MATSTVRVAITAEDRTSAAFNSVKEKLSGLQRSVSSFHSMMSTMGGFLGAQVVMGAVRGLKDMGEAVYNDTVTWQGMQYTLEAAGLSSQQTNAELKFMTDTANTLGIGIKDISASFSRFILTAKTAGETMPEANAQFQAISEAMRVFHLSSNQTTRSWLALSEVMAMGTLRSRQFNQQLGRDWPGIGALIAQAMFPGENSMKRFTAAMDKGQISSQMFMQGMVQVMQTPAMQGALDGAVNSIQAAMGRLHNSIFLLFNQAQNPAALASMTDALNTMASTINQPDIKTGFDNLVVMFANIATVAIKAAAAIGNFYALLSDNEPSGGGIQAMKSQQDWLRENIKQTQQDEAGLHYITGGGTSGGWHIGATPDQLARVKEDYAEIYDLQVKIDNYNNPTKSWFAKHGTDTINKPESGAGTSGELPTGMDKVSSKIQANAARAAIIMQSVNAQILVMNRELASMPTVSKPETSIGMQDWSIALENVTSAQKKSAANTKLIIADIRSTIGTEVNGVKVTAAQAQEAINNLTKSSTTDMTEFAKSAERNIQDSTARMFETIGSNANNLKSVLHSLFKSLADDAANMLAKTILTGSSGTGGLWGALFSTAGSAIQGHAAGGPVSANRISLVGEAGPELFMPSTSGTIFPNNALRGMGGHSTSINIDARGAGPDEIAKLMSMRNEIMTQTRSDTEFRLQRGSWRTNKLTA